MADKDNDIKSVYKFTALIGKGSFSSVVKAEHRESHELFAVKIIDKLKLSQSDLDYLIQEIEILSNLEHPNIVKLHEFFEDNNFFYMVFDYMAIGDLHNYIKSVKSLTESDIKNIIIPIADAIRYCNMQDISHRDLKPENIIFSANNLNASNGHLILKLADFGFARVSNDGLMSTQCGTHIFIAPEILENKAYDKSCDIWSLGVLFYYLFTGTYPFNGNESLSEIKDIVQSKLFNNTEIWSKVSPEAKDLLSNMLIYDTQKRVKVNDIISHPWTEKAILNKEDFIKNHNN